MSAKSHLLPPSPRYGRHPVRWRAPGPVAGL